MSTEYENAMIQKMLEANSNMAKTLADTLAAAHLQAVQTLLAQSKPEKIYQRGRIDSATYTVPIVVRMPFKGLGGLHVYNASGATVSIYVGGDIAGLADAEAAPHIWISQPFNAWENRELVTFKLSGASTGIVRYILSSEDMGPSDGTAA